MQCKGVPEEFWVSVQGKKNFGSPITINYLIEALMKCSQLSICNTFFWNAINNCIYLTLLFHQKPPSRCHRAPKKLLWMQVGQIGSTSTHWSVLVLLFFSFKKNITCHVCSSEMNHKSSAVGPGLAHLHPYPGCLRSHTSPKNILKNLWLVETSDLHQAN
jgi:hypothetical protein